jgi:hypothetical protein
MKKFTPTLLLCAFTFFLVAQTPQQLELMAADIGENATYFSSEIELKLPQDARFNVAKTSTATIQLDSIYDYEGDYNGNLLRNYKYVYRYTANGQLSQAERHTWEKAGAFWEKNNKREFFYDANNQLVLEIQYDEDQGNWRPEKKEETIYNAYGDVTEVIGYEADGGGWNMYYRETYDYDSNGWLIERVEYLYENGAWNPEWRGEYSYDNTGLLLIYQTSFYYQGVWQNDLKRTYAYDANGNVISLIRQNNNNGAWENDRKETHAYDASNQDTLSITYDWDGSVWENYFKSHKAYDGNGNNLVRKDYVWQNNDWGKQYKWEFTYDANNNMTQRLFSTSWNDQWGYSSKYDYIFDAFDNMIREDRYSYSNGVWTLQEKDEWLFDTSIPVSDIWCNITYPYYDYGYKILGTANYEAMGSGWEIQDSLAFFYGAIAFGVKEYEVEKLAIYPNPTTGMIMIETKSTIEKNIALIDMLGNQIMLINTYNMNVELNMSRLPNGVYFIKIAQGKNISVNRVVKQ